MIIERPKKAPQPIKRQRPEGIRNIVGIYSGKGGVGKTTFSIMLSYFLVKRGYRVGLLDLDIDCANIPRSLGIMEKHQVGQGRQIKPLNFAGIKIVSMGGILADDQQPLIWRGQMASKAVEQLFFDSSWGDLDILVVDFPPGTGDEPLTFFSFIVPEMMVLIATPQNNAWSDTVKALTLCRKMSVPVGGIVSNMEGRIFGHLEPFSIEQRLQLPLLGAWPLSKKLAGGPFWLESEKAPFARTLKTIEKMIFRD